MDRPEHLAFIAEDVDPDFDDPDVDVLSAAGGTSVGCWLTGTFSVHIEGTGNDEDVFESGPESAPLDEALAWARARTDAIVIRLGDRRHLYSAGDRPLPVMRTWPPPDLRPLVRRREPGEEWKDRTPSDPPITWNVQVLLTLPIEATEDTRTSDDAPIEAFAARAGAVHWDRESLDGFLADIKRSAGSFWSSTHAPAWRLHFQVDAPTRKIATKRVLSRLADPPDGLTVAAAALPAASTDAAQKDAAEQRVAFEGFISAYQPVPGDDPLTSALDALILTEAVPHVDQLAAFVERHGVELGDNHFSTARTQWLPVLDESDDRALLVEADEHGLVDSASIVRVDTRRQVG